MLSNNLRLKFCYLKIIHILNQRYHPKVRGHILKSKRKSKCVCIPEIRQLNIMKMTMKMKKRSRRFDINRSRCRHGRKYGKYIMFLIMMMVICIKQHLSDIWSSIHDKIKQHWGWVEEKRCSWKSVYSWIFNFAKNTPHHRTLFSK